MPYIDPERNRQWELEHREKRNARRRARALAFADDRSCSEPPMFDPTISQASNRRINLIPALSVGLTILTILLFAGWRPVAFRNRPGPGQTRVRQGEGAFCRLYTPPRFAFDPLG